MGTIYSIWLTSNFFGVSMADFEDSFSTVLKAIDEALFVAVDTELSGQTRPWTANVDSPVTLVNGLPMSSMMISMFSIQAAKVAPCMLPR